MATYYWIGGSATWTSANTANWSTTNGGTTAGVAPTSSDDVNFTSLSNATDYTVTVTTGVARSINIAGPLAGAVTWAGSTAWIIFGSLTVAGSGVTWTNSATMTFAGTTTGWTITTNGVSLSSPFVFNGVGGGWTLGSALTTTGAVVFTNGSFNDGGFALSALRWSSSNSNTRVLTRSGTWALSGSGTAYTQSTATGLTVNDTGKVQLTNSGSTATTFLGGSGITTNELDVTAGTYALGITGSTEIFGTLNFTGFAGALTVGNAKSLTGNITFGSGMTTVAGANAISFTGTSGTQTITTNGVSILFPLTVNTSGSTVSLGDALTMNTATAADGVLTLTNGTLTLNGHNATASSFSSSNSNTRALTFTGSEVLSLAGTATVFDAGTSTGFTVTPASGTITTTDNSASSKTFAGGGLTYHNLYFSGGAGTGTYILTGANTFNEIQFDTSTAIQTLTLPASTTTTLSAANLAINGTASFQNVLNSSSSGTAATLSLASGTISLSYVSLQDQIAIGGATFNALLSNGNINVSNNNGWEFNEAGGVEAQFSRRAFRHRQFSVVG